jgi:hypothetical protein
MTERFRGGRHFALIELATGNVLQRIPVTDQGHMAVIAQEGRLRAELGVDEAGSGVVLRDSGLDQF